MQCLFYRHNGCPCWLTLAQVLEVAKAQGEFCRFAAQTMAEIFEAKLRRDDDG